MSDPMYHEPHGKHQSRKAAASGWIGSALEYYDFFIYASAAALVFPEIFFPSGNPTIAIVASLATYGVGYIARPIGAFFLGHWGDTHGRKTVLLLCMFLMGFSTMAVGILPTYQQAGILAPVLLVMLRLVQGFAVAGEISAALAIKPQVFITLPVELRILKSMSGVELEEYAAEHGWRIVRRIGGRQIEFYNDVTVRPPDDKSRLT